MWQKYRLIKLMKKGLPTVCTEQAFQVPIDGEVHLCEKQYVTKRKIKWTWDQSYAYF